MKRRPLIGILGMGTVGAGCVGATDSEAPSPARNADDQPPVGKLLDPPRDLLLKNESNTAQLIEVHLSTNTARIHRSEYDLAEQTTERIPDVFVKTEIFSLAATLSDGTSEKQTRHVTPDVSHVAVTVTADHALVLSFPVA